MTSAHYARFRQTYAVRDTTAPGWSVVLTSSFLILWWLTIVWGDVLTAVAPDLQPSDALTATDQGSSRNVFLVVTFAIVGLLYLRDRYRVLLAPENRVVLATFCIYLAWSLTSLAWTVDLGLSVRRYGELVLLVVGSFGIGVGFYGAHPRGLRLLVLHVIMAGALAQLALWWVLLTSGDVRLFDPKWAVKAITGSPVAFPTTFALFAAIHLFGDTESRWWKLLLIGFVGLCLLTLFAQKMRMVEIAVALLVGVLVIRRFWSANKYLLILAALIVVTFTLFIYALIGDVAAPLRDTVWTYISLDSSDNDIQTLTGRVPLWNALLDALQNRPWQGYGFGAFWSSTTLEQIWQAVGWSAVTAHNGFLDEALGTGYIGLVAFLLAWVTGICWSFRARTGELARFAPLMVQWLVLFLLFNAAGSILQMYFQFPFYVCLIGLATMMRTSASQQSSTLPAVRLGRRSARPNSADERVARA